MNQQGTYTTKTGHGTVRDEGNAIGKDKMRKNWLAGAVVFVIAVLLGGSSAVAQTYYVRSGASGNGSDWANAYGALPATLVRGATYYIASGSYGTYQFDDPVSGTKLITVKKATATDHGTETGWAASYGTGAALWSSLDFDSDYYIFDGQTRDENSWFSGSSYGFKITGGEQQIRMGHSGRAVSNVQIRYTYLLAIQGGLSTTVTGRRYGLDMDTFGGTSSPHGSGVVVHRCFFQYGNVPIFSHAQDGLIVEYSAVDSNESNGANHGEAISAYYTNDRWIIRYNKFKGIQGTAVVAFTHATAGGAVDGFEIYGNVIWDCSVGDGAFGFDNTAYPFTNCKIYNNTIVDKAGGYNNGIAMRSGSNNQVYNNLWVNCSSGFWNGAGATYNNNAYSWSVSEPGAQVNVPTSIFVNYAGDDFRLASATAAGSPLVSPYNLDLLGATRGGDGVWDRGAYDYGSSPASGLTVNAGPDIQVTLPNSASLTATIANTLGGTLGLTWSKVSGPGTVTFGSGSAASTSASFSTAGTYVLRLTARVLTVTVTDDVTVTVLPQPDTTAPSVTLTGPASGNVSGQVSLSATASDNIGVEGVKFFVGNSSVADVTASPYSTLWDSRWVANGSYKVYAQARDAAGNIKWSATNTVTISNAVNALPAASVYWSFDESSGTSATDMNAGSVLTLRNGPLWVPGKTGNALQLDGVNERADAPNNPAFDYDGDKLTVAAWVKLENLNNWQQIVVKVKETGAFTAPFFAWHLFAGTVSSNQWRPQFQLVNVDQNSVNVSSTNVVNYSEWVHVAGVYDGTAVRIYVNGEEQGNAPQSGNIIRFAQPLYVGSSGLPGEFAKGAIDDLRIYSGALSAAQIQQLANSGAPRPLSPPTGLRIEGGL